MQTFYLTLRFLYMNKNGMQIFCRLTQDIKDITLIKCVPKNKSKISKRKNRVASFVLYGLTWNLAA